MATWKFCGLPCGLNPFALQPVVLQAPTSNLQWPVLYEQPHWGFPPSGKAASSANIPKLYLWTHVFYMQVLWNLPPSRAMCPSSQVLSFCELEVSFLGGNRSQFTWAEGCLENKSQFFLEYICISNEHLTCRYIVCRLARAPGVKCWEQGVFLQIIFLLFPLALSFTIFPPDWNFLSFILSCFEVFLNVPPFLPLPLK